MVIKNITSLSGDEALNILITSTSREFKKRFIYLGLLVLVGIIVLVLGLALKQNNITIMGAVICAIAIGFFVYSLIDIKRMKKRVLKQNPDVCATGVDYNCQFKENSCQVICKLGGKTKRLDYSYETLKYIYEDNDGYELLFMPSDSIYILKSGFESKKHEEIFRMNVTSKKRKIKQR